jgi:phosphate-selective porin OprO/OprP
MRALLPALLLCAFTSARPAVAETADVSVSGGGLTVRQGDNSFQLGGRIQADCVWFAGSDTVLNDGTDVRRMRLVAKGTFERVWKFKLEYDFADSKIKDMFITRKTGVGNLTYGQFSPPISFESLQTSKWIMFLERSLPVEALLPDRELGLMFDTGGDALFFSASVTGDNVDNDDAGDDSPTAMTRLVWAPLHSAGDVLHFAVSSGYVDSPTQGIFFGARPEARVDATTRLVSATIAGATQHWLGGVEAAFASGPFSVQAEYIGASVDGGGDPYFDGFYVSASWFLNGDMRSYDTGYQVFDRPVTARDSVELAVRYSRLDLSDRNLGNRQDDATLGINYYPNPILRFSANLIHGRVDNGAAPAEEVNVVAMRGQVVF